MAVGSLCWNNTSSNFAATQSQQQNLLFSKTCEDNSNKMNSLIWSGGDNTIGGVWAQPNSWDHHHHHQRANNPWPPVPQLADGADEQAAWKQQQMANPKPNADHEDEVANWKIESILGLIVDSSNADEQSAPSSSSDRADSLPASTSDSTTDMFSPFAGSPNIFAQPLNQPIGGYPVWSAGSNEQQRVSNEFFCSADAVPPLGNRVGDPTTAKRVSQNEHPTADNNDYFSNAEREYCLIRELLKLNLNEEQMQQEQQQLKQAGRPILGRTPTTEAAMKMGHSSSHSSTNSFGSTSTSTTTSSNNTINEGPTVADLYHAALPLLPHNMHQQQQPAGLPVQQAVYDQIYNMIVSGHLPLPKQLLANRLVNVAPNAVPPMLGFLHQQQRNSVTTPQAANSCWRGSPVTRSDSYVYMFRSVRPAVMGALTSSSSSSNNSGSSSAAALELHGRLEECNEQYKKVERERKKTEAELARHNLGKKISSANSIPIPRLPTAPSRVDRLVVDFFREHARMTTLLAKMEQLLGEPLAKGIHGAMMKWCESLKALQQCRLQERANVLQQLRVDFASSRTCQQSEKDTVALSAALRSAIESTQRARSANWCALVTTLHRRHGGPPADCQRQMDAMTAVDFNCEPPPIQTFGPITGTAAAN